MRSEIIEIWQRTGKTIVFVTHEIDEALELADRIVVLSAKPTRMLKTIDLKLVRPRDLNSAALRAARTELKQLLGVIESEETAS
jgi:NitT/TauT family transport system ATP-binding protein